MTIFGYKYFYRLPLTHTGIQHGGVQAVCVQYCKHGEAQFPVPEWNAANYVFSEKLRGTEEGMETHRDGYLLLRELLQKRQQDQWLLHDRVVHRRVPVRPRHLLFGLRVPVHVFYVTGN